MAKDAYYFSHDSNAKDDPKCVMLIEELGLEGYGIYWVLIETLRDQPEYKYPLSLIPAIARRYNTTVEKMKAVVGNYGLFVTDEHDFFSLSLMERMKHLDHKREMARIAGKKSAEKRLLNSGSTDVQQTFNDGSTSKVKESKVNKNIIVLSADESDFLAVLEKIKDYPLDREKDIEMLNVLKERYPQVDPLEAIKDWAFHKISTPLKDGQNPRSQINTSFKKCVEWNKCLKKPDKPQEQVYHPPLLV